MSTDTTHPDWGFHDEKSRLVLDGASRKDITADFLLGIHELAEREGITVDGISVGEY